MRRALMITVGSGLALFPIAGHAQGQRGGRSGSEGRSFESREGANWGTPREGSWNRGWYGGGYGGPYYGWDYYRRPNYYGRYPDSDYYPYTSYYGPESDDQSGAPGQSNAAARILVVVPPEARVWVDDQPTRQMGFERLFWSPPLERGRTYSYTIRASWMENSKEVSKEKKVRVEPGRMTMANFMPQREEQRTQEFRRAEYGSEEKRGDRSEREQLKLQDAGTPNRTEREDSRQNDRFRKKQSAQPSDSERQERAETQHPISGKIVRVEDDQLIISLDTGEQQTVRVPTDTRILLDGQKSDLGALKAGMHVAITTKAGNADVAAELEVKKTRSTSERQNPTDR